MGWIGTTVSAITGVASLISGGGGGGFNLGGLMSNVGNIVGDLWNAGKSVIETIGSDVGGILRSIDNFAGPVFKAIDNDINSVANFIDQFVSPISKLFTDITNTVNLFNDKIILPIANIFNTFNTQIRGLGSEIEKDFHDGISGLLKFPTDLANALTSVDAQFNRATQQLGEYNRSTVNDDLVPGLGTAIGTPISDIKDALLGPEFEKVNDIDDVFQIDISDPEAPNKILQSIQSAINMVQNDTGLVGNLSRGLWHVLQIADYLLKKAEISLQPVYQEALKTQAYNLLSPGEAVEAQRRGIISEESFSNELLRQGINGDRQAVLLELSNYLIGVRDAIVMHERGIISDKDFADLMTQNKLYGEQPQALLEMMQHTLAPADVAAGVARGYISPSIADAMYKATLVPNSLRDIIPELELKLLDPAKMIMMQGRLAAADNGFMSKTLNSLPPSNIKDQYDRTQAESPTVDYDWLAHWHIPEARWWVVAYFRGLRNIEELHDAFTALRIPEEIWDDIIQTEREIPPVWLVPDIVGSGVWEESQAIPTLKMLGFSDENAQVLYDYGKSKQASTTATAANDLSKISLSNARNAFDDGLIDETTYITILTDHGYSTDAAQITVELAKYEQSIAELKNQAELLLAEVKVGIISKTDAESSLYNLGLNTTQVAQYLTKIESASVLNAKLPDMSELKTMYTKGIIQESEALETLQLLGYSALWAERIIQTW